MKRNRTDHARWRHPLTCLICAAGTALLCGAFLQSAGLVIAAAIAGLILVGIAWPWIGLRGIVCTIRFERRRANEGDAVPVIVNVRNRWPWPVWGLKLQNGFETDACPSAELQTAVAMAKVQGWATTSFHWQFTPNCRGEYPLDQPWIATGFPFGLWNARRKTTVENRLLVRPATFPVSSIPQTEGSDCSGFCLSELRPGDAGDFLGVRPYRRGDSLRRIHWTQTARLGRLIVCERQAPTRPTAQIVLDAEAAIHCGDGSDSSLQWATRITASLCKCFLQNNASVECTIGQQTIPATSDAHDFELVLDALGRIPKCGFAEPNRAASARNASVVLQHEVIITTDRGLSRWNSDKSQASQRHLIVLQADSFSRDPDSLNAIVPQTNLAGIRIEHNDSIPAHFAHQWERLSA